MNLIDISKKFPTELDVIKHFETVRWKNKIHCAHCNSNKIGLRNKDYRFHCKSCKKSFSVTTNTRLHNTRLPLKTWMYAFALICDAKKGISAKQIERHLGIHYETAWNMYHKIRELMFDDEYKLNTIVEMDEMYIGGKPRHEWKGEFKGNKKQVLDKQIKHLKQKHGIEFINPDSKPKKTVGKVKRGRGTNKVPVVGIVQRNGNVIAQVMRVLTYENLKAMVEKHVQEEKSVLITDEFRSYNQLASIIDKISVEHQKKVYSYKGVNTNTIESFWAIVKRGIIGQYHRVSLKHLPKYIQELVFKWNNRKEDDMFETLIKNSMKPIK